MADKQGEKKITELKARKDALRREMTEIRKEIDGSLSLIHDNVTSRIRVNYWVEKHPLRVIGVGLLAGFLTSRLSRKKKNTEKNRGIFFSILTDELKKAAARKLVRLATEKMEEAAQRRKSEKD
ncbi:hypothetical protein QLX67_09315 [Balneolaceae bacterium ANBcel3]|nr:hypothetical protein [Balneolaceae bacterium ANBcel3]